MFQNVQPDWSENDSSKESYILNKPVIPEDLRDYLCFTALEANSTVAMDTYNNAPTTYKPTVEYSTDKITWHTLITNDTPASPVTLANVGDRVWVRGDNAHFSANNTDYTKFVLTGKVNVSGNIMSLLDKTCKQITLPTASEDLQSYVFASLFYNNSALVDASELELPALTMVYGCYYSMFRSCSNLVNAPNLPATTLATYCYGGMFRDCTSLTDAPYLPVTAITGVSNVYATMFRGCSSLKRIKVPFTSFNGIGSSWMQDVPATGIFECPSVLDISTRDTSHVPVGWTIVRIDAPQSDWTQTDATEASYILNKPDLSQFALSSNLASVAFTGNYADLTSTPDLTIYAQTSALASVAFTGNYADLSNTPDLTDYAQTSDLASVALTGNYSDLTSTPDIGAEISNALASAGALTSSDVAAVALSGDYADLSNTPDVSAEISSALSNAGALTSSDVAAVALSGDYSDLINTPDLTIYAETTSLASVALTGDYNDLSSTPDLTNFVESSTLEAYTPTASLASVALTGNYSDISNTPDLSQYVESSVLEAYTLTESLASVALTGDYSDLTCKPNVEIKEIDSIDHTIYFGKRSNGASPRAAYIECISGSTYVISAEAPVAYMDAAVPDSSTYIGYNEVIIDYNSGATISGDSNVSIVDALTADKRNICVARWDPLWEVSSGVYGGAKLYVVITEDLPQA